MDGPEPLFRWHATSGGFAPFLRGTMPRDASPWGWCGNRGLAQELEHRVVERTRELWHSKERLSALANELNLTEQRERKCLATELHDHLQQILVLSKLKLAQGKG